MTMKASELKEIVDRLVETRRDDHSVMVLVNRGFPAVGGRHMVGMKSVSVGFDWERGRLILTPTEPVYAGIEDMEKATKFAHRVREAIYMMRHDKGRAKNANAITHIIRHLDEWLPDRSEKE
jgi:hypothetical protein